MEEMVILGRIGTPGNGSDFQNKAIFILASLFKKKLDRLYLIGPRTAMLAVVNYNIQISKMWTDLHIYICTYNMQTYSLCIYVCAIIKRE